MKLFGRLRPSGGGAVEPITVLRLTGTGCLIEATRTLELGQRIVLELEAGSASATAAGEVTALNDLQLLYNIQFDDGSAPGRDLLEAVRELNVDAGD